MRKKIYLGVMLSTIASSILMAETFELGKVEVSSEKDISANLTTQSIDAQTIKETQSKNTVQALTELPGIFIDQNGAKGQMDVRVRGFKKSRVPVYIDGIPVYVPYNKETDLSRFTTYDLSEIEVSKGYVSPMYGVNTMGGAINLITKKPTKRLEGELGAGVFSGSGHEEYLTMGTNQGKYYGLISMSNYSRDYFNLSNGYTANTYEDGGKRENSDSQDRKLNIKVGYTPNDTDEYAFNYIMQRGEKGQPYYADNTASPVAFATNRHWRWPDWDKTSYYFLTKTAIGNSTLVKTRWYRDEFYNKMESFDNLPAVDTIANSTSEYDDYTLGGNIELNFKLTESQTLKLAVSQKQDYHKSIDSTKPGLDTKSEGTTTSYGIEYALKATDKLTWVAGASYDKNNVDKAEYITSSNTIGEYDKYDSSSFNPETALYYTLSDMTTFYGSIAKKSNMPSLSDRYSTKFSTYLPNPGLKAERSLNYEIGMEQKITDTHMAHVALFLTKADDYIASVKVGALSQSRNIGKEEHKGVEISLDSLWDDGLSTNLSYTYIDAEVKDNPAYPYVTDIPKHSIIGRLKYSPTATVDIIPQVRYESERYINNAAIYSSYLTNDFFLMDLKMAYRPMKAFELAVGVKNLFDRNYYYSYGYPQEGRSYYANARYTF